MTATDALTTTERCSTNFFDEWEQQQHVAAQVVKTHAERQHGCSEGRRQTAGACMAMEASQAGTLTASELDRWQLVADSGDARVCSQERAACRAMQSSSHMAPQDSTTSADGVAKTGNGAAVQNEHVCGAMPSDVGQQADAVIQCACAQVQRLVEAQGGSAEQLAVKFEEFNATIGVLTEQVRGLREAQEEQRRRQEEQNAAFVKWMSDMREQQAALRARMLEGMAVVRLALENGQRIMAAAIERLTAAVQQRLQMATPLSPVDVAVTGVPASSQGKAEGWYGWYDWMRSQRRKHDKQWVAVHYGWASSLTVLLCMGVRAGKAWNAFMRAVHGNTPPPPIVTAINTTAINTTAIATTMACEAKSSVTQTEHAEDEEQRRRVMQEGPMVLAWNARKLAADAKSDGAQHKWRRVDEALTGWLKRETHELLSCGVRAGKAWSAFMRAMHGNTMAEPRVYEHMEVDADESNGGSSSTGTGQQSRRPKGRTDLGRLWGDVLAQTSDAIETENNERSNSDQGANLDTSKMFAQEECTAASNGVRQVVQNKSTGASVGPLVLAWNARKLAADPRSAGAHEKWQRVEEALLSLPLLLWLFEIAGKLEDMRKARRWFKQRGYEIRFLVGEGGSGRELGEEGNHTNGIIAALHMRTARFIEYRRLHERVMGINIALRDAQNATLNWCGLHGMHKAKPGRSFATQMKAVEQWMQLGGGGIVTADFNFIPCTRWREALVRTEQARDRTRMSGNDKLLRLACGCTCACCWADGDGESSSDMRVEAVTGASDEISWTRRDGEHKSKIDWSIAYGQEAGKWSAGVPLFQQSNGLDISDHAMVSLQRQCFVKPTVREARPRAALPLKGKKASETQHKYGWAVRTRGTAGELAAKVEAAMEQGVSACEAVTLTLVELAKETKPRMNAQAAREPKPRHVPCTTRAESSCQPCCNCNEVGRICSAFSALRCSDARRHSGDCGSACAGSQKWRWQGQCSRIYDGR